jgi:hypothetical protein
MKTTSEIAFEAFLAENGLPFQKVEEGGQRKPDYLVEIGESKLLFEVKELSDDDKVEVLEGATRVSSRTIGDHIRRKIVDARKQIQFGANQGIPSVLLIYNNIDPEHLFGTEEHDFIAAMYGERTLVIDKSPPEIVDAYYGHNHSFREARNTSFSALGLLRSNQGKLKVTLVENAFAKLKIPYDLLPAFFEVRRCQIAQT